MTPPVDAHDPRPVRAVAFDWAGTLTPWHEVDVRAPWRELARGLGTDEREVEALVEVLHRTEREAAARSRTEHRSGRLVDLLAQAGLDAEDARVRAALAAYEQAWEPHTLTDPQVRPLWEGLHERGIRVGVLSNTLWTRAYHRGVFARDGVLGLLDADVYSSEIPWAKPHPEAFLAVARALEVDPRECVYVGDRSFEDVHGPQQVGMRAVLVPHSRIPVEEQVPHGAHPDAVVHELREVLAVVDRWVAQAGPGRDD